MIVEKCAQNQSGPMTCEAAPWSSCRARDAVKHFRGHDLIVLTKSEVLRHSLGPAPNLGCVDDGELAPDRVPECVLHGEMKRTRPPQGRGPVGTQRVLAAYGGGAHDLEGRRAG